MAEVSYEIVEHNGGWAYKFDGVFSETYPTHDLAYAAARRVVAEQQSPGDTQDIEYEDENGVWHTERSDGADRPLPEIVDP